MLDDNLRVLTRRLNDLEIELADKNDKKSYEFEKKIAEIFIKSKLQMMEGNTIAYFGYK